MCILEARNATLILILASEVNQACEESIERLQLRWSFDDVCQMRVISWSKALVTWHQIGFEYEPILPMHSVSHGFTHHKKSHSLSKKFNLCIFDIFEIQPHLSEERKPSKEFFGQNMTFGTVWCRLLGKADSTTKLKLLRSESSEKWSHQEI